MDRTSSKPRVVIRAVRAPFLSSREFVATVVPWTRLSTRSRGAPRDWSARRKAIDGSAGVDGTLRNRLRGRYTTARVWAKTGSLQGVATLAGYVRNQSDDLLAFAIFANHYNEDEGSVLTVIDNIVTTLARSR